MSGRGRKLPFAGLDGLAPTAAAELHRKRCVGRNANVSCLAEPRFPIDLSAHHFRGRCAIFPHCQSIDRPVVLAAMRRATFLSLLMLSACSAPGGPYPSLQPRAAEAIDPRVPVVRPMNDRPAGAVLTARLAALVDQAQGGNAAFDRAASEAERLSSAAGSPQSEGWISAQQALSGAIAARQPTVQALGDIDEMAANALQTQRGIAPNDLAAIQRAAELVGGLDRGQSERIDAIQQRLGI